MIQIKTFECDGNNENKVNEWLAQNPDIEVINIFYQPMYDFYYYTSPPQICNQYIITTVIYKEVK